MGNGSASCVHSLLVFCKVDVEVLSPFTSLSVAYPTVLHHVFHKSWDDGGLRVIGIHIEEVFVVRVEHRAMRIDAFELFCDVLFFCPVVFEHLDYANVFYHHIKALRLLAPNDFSHGGGKVDFRGFFVAALVGVDSVVVFAFFVLAKVDLDFS